MGKKFSGEVFHHFQLVLYGYPFDIICKLFTLLQCGVE